MLLGIEDFKINIPTLFYLIVLLALTTVGLLILRKVIYKSTKIDLGRKFAIYSLVKYVVYVFGFVLGLQIIGINLSVLMAGSAALLVGVGLGLQNLFSDFVSGIIILVDSSVKVNDIIEVNGLICKVRKIQLRTTTVLTRENKFIILPNTDLTKSHLINWTHSNLHSRFFVTVGVDYASDIKLVMRLLTEASKVNKDILTDPPAFVRFEDYGESSLNFALYFWTDEIFIVENIKSEIRIRIFELFQQHNITIPFPQRVLHVKQDKPLPKTYIDSLK